jgi:hypothetical protein
VPTHSAFIDIHSLEVCTTYHRILLFLLIHSFSLLPITISISTLLQFPSTSSLLSSYYFRFHHHYCLLRSRLICPLLITILISSPSSKATATSLLRLSTVYFAASYFFFREAFVHTYIHTYIHTPIKVHTHTNIRGCNKKFPDLVVNEICTTINTR